MFCSEETDENTQQKSLFSSLFVNSKTNNLNDNIKTDSKIDTNDKNNNENNFVKKNNESENNNNHKKLIKKNNETDNKDNDKKLEIFSTNKININPSLKNKLVTLKKYFNTNESQYKKFYRAKAYSFDMSANTDNDTSKIISNFENTFCKKLSIDSPKKTDVRKIKIKCHINEPYKISFSMLVGKKLEISLLKKTICEQLAKKNKAYKDLNIRGFCLMKNYAFIHEFGNVGDSILSDGDDVYIILNESMDKCQENKKEKLEKSK